MNDFLSDNNGDILIVDGDFATGTSDQLHQRSILAARKGDNKEYPVAGAGIEDYLNDDDIEGMLSEIRRQFKYDGLKVNSLTFENGTLNIDANYE